jgi:glycerol-3-phosphate dehydrogenase
MGKFSIEYRKSKISQIQDQQYDLLIIGGGITGAGILLDAQARGLKALLVEMQDFASGTSSRSTKLIHGGLRYLKQLEFKLVADVGRERAIVYENGPHVTRSEPMLLPLITGGTINSFGAFVGIWLYDKLAGVKKHEHRKMLSKEKTLEAEPLLSKENLNGGAYYYEYRTDDARLTIEIIKEGVERGGVALNYSKLTSFIYEEGKIKGAIINDLLNNYNFTIKANRVVNAAGPWVDEVMKLDDVKKSGNLFLTKGVHIVVDYKKFPLKQSVYFDVKDGRMVFAIPRDGKTYIGTTDTEYHDNLANPEITLDDKTYILNAIKHVFPSVNISINDIESGWAGLRPLVRQAGKLPSEISRKDEVYVNDSGLISIAGGKLTGYRKMAKKILDKIGKLDQKDLKDCTTHKIPISGGKVGGSANFIKFVRNFIQEGIKLGVSENDARAVAEIYGSNAPIVFDLLCNNRQEAEKSRIPDLLFARLLYSVEYEMAITPTDFFGRRTGMIYFNLSEVEKYKDVVIAWMATKFNWSNELVKKYREELEFQVSLAKGKSD